jgi:hypothetical protein
MKHGAKAMTIAFMATSVLATPVAADDDDSAFRQAWILLNGDGGNLTGQVPTPSYATSNRGNGAWGGGSDGNANSSANGSSNSSSNGSSNSSSNGSSNSSSNGSSNSSSNGSSNSSSNGSSNSSSNGSSNSSSNGSGDDDGDDD